MKCEKRTVTGLREAVGKQKTIVGAALALLTAPGTVVGCDFDAAYRMPAPDRSRLCEGHAREIAEAMQLGSGTLLGLLLEEKGKPAPSVDVLLARWRKNFARGRQ